MNHLHLLEVHEFNTKIRQGAHGDGGYIHGVLDNFEYDCYISAGVSNEESFTRGFMIDNNMNEFNSYAFDGTIARYPYEYTTNIAFIRKNIGSINDNNVTNLHGLIEKYERIFLKMDIEGGEYPWLNSLTEEQLGKFSQIAIEFHGLTDDEWGCSYDEKVKCLEKLSRTHYIIHAHGNNYGKVVNGFPDVLELTYVNKKYFGIKPELNKIALPMANFDFPNDPYQKDIDLGGYPFTNM
jgi:hypothetical protein